MLAPPRMRIRWRLFLTPRIAIQVQSRKFHDENANGADGAAPSHMVGYELKLKVTNAARHGATTVVEEWFKSGSRDPDATDLYGQGLLYLAAFHGQRDVVRILLARGASVGASNGTDGATALHGAAVHGCCDVAVLLLDAGARIDARDACGNTPLLRAALDDRRDMLRLLLARGAVLDVCGAHGRDAEAFAYRYGHHETALYLTEIRLAGGWRRYVRAPRERLVMLRILVEQGRAETRDDLLVRLFPAGRRRRRVLKRPREAYRAQEGGRLPHGIFVHITGYWRSSRDYLGPAPDGA